MSIIHDALKKVQKSMQQNSTIPAAINSLEEKIEVLPSASSGINKKAANQNPLWLLIIVSFLILTLGVVFLFMHLHLSSYFKFSPKTSSPQSTAPVVVAAAAPTPIKTAVNTPATSTTAATPATPVPPLLNIEGVMASNGHNVALINNNVYEEGSVVNGQKILKIDLDAITVEHDGQQEVIQIKK